jgi:hypothetical protein
VSFPAVDEIARYYEDRKAEVLRKHLRQPAEWQALEGIHHEALALDIVMGCASALGLHVAFGLNDLNPGVYDSDGVLCERDFRLRIEGEEILFGATRVSFNGRDCEKDVTAVDVPVRDLTINGVKQPDDRSRVVSIQSWATVLRRKIAVRVATEGKRIFPCDYVYLLFWYEHPYSTWPDILPDSFTFEQRSADGYEIREKGFSGLCLIGAAGSVRTTAMPHDAHFELRTHTFPKAGDTIRRLMGAMNRRRIKAM